MPAHAPRLSFAKPFIVTFAAASVVGCEPKSVAVEPPSHNPPEQDVPPAQVETAAPTVPSPHSWKIARTGDGTCTAQINVECAAGRTCAQPKAEPYPCLPMVLNYPAGVRADSATSKCQAYWDYPPIQCPPGSFCNPPATQLVDDVPCPK